MYQDMHLLCPPTLFAYSLTFTVQAILHQVSSVQMSHQLYSRNKHHTDYPQHRCYCGDHHRSYLCYYTFCWIPGWSSAVSLYQQTAITTQTWASILPTAAGRSTVWGSAGRSKEWMRLGFTPSAGWTLETRPSRALKRMQIFILLARGPPKIEIWVLYSMFVKLHHFWDGEPTALGLLRVPW